MVLIRKISEKSDFPVSVVVTTFGQRFVLVILQVLCVRGCRKLWQKNTVDAGEAEVVQCRGRIQEKWEECGLDDENCRCPNFYDKFDPFALGRQWIIWKNKQLKHQHPMVPWSLNCKTLNVIYLWKWKLCHDECYFGRTPQKCHVWTNGHRSCFNDVEKWRSPRYRCR